MFHWKVLSGTSLEASEEVFYFPAPNPKHDKGAFRRDRHRGSETI